MSETLKRQRKMFKKARKCKEEKWQATKNQFYKVISRIKDSFNRGKDLINDDLLEMEMCVHEIKQLRRNFDFANKIAKLNGSDDDSELDDFDNEIFSSTGKLDMAQLKRRLQKDQVTKPAREASSNLDAYNFGSINLRNQNIGLTDNLDVKTYKANDHIQHSNLLKFAETGSSKQTARDNDLTAEQVRSDQNQIADSALIDKFSPAQDAKYCDQDPDIEPKPASSSPSALSDDFNKIDTDEVNGMFCNDNDSQFRESQLLMRSGQSQKDATNEDIDKQLKITDKEISLYQDEKQTTQKVVPEQPKSNVKSTAAARTNNNVFLKSEKPRNKRSKNEEIIQAIIEKDKRKGDDIAVLEAEMLAVETDPEDEEFQPLLPDLSGIDKDHTNNVDWNDVDSDQLLEAEEELMDDHDLIGDINISKICPPFDSESKNSKGCDEHLNSNSSKLKSKTKLNCTVPKNMAGFWNDSKRLNLKCATLPYNQLAEVKSIGDFITPKRIDTKDENYSQASTPVPGYSKKTSASRQLNKNAVDKQTGKAACNAVASKVKVQGQLKLADKCVNKSAIAVKDEQGYFSVQTKKDFK